MSIDNVNHPAHYTQGFEQKPIECIDFTRYMCFNRGNAFKYVWRAGKKGDPEKAMEDLAKAEWYLKDCTFYNDEVAEPVFALFRLIQKPDDACEKARYDALYGIIRAYDYHDLDVCIEIFKFKLNKKLKGEKA